MGLLPLLQFETGLLDLTVESPNKTRLCTMGNDIVRRHHTFCRLYHMGDQFSFDLTEKIGDFGTAYHR